MGGLYLLELGGDLAFSSWVPIRMVCEGYRPSQQQSNMRFLADSTKLLELLLDLRSVGVGCQLQITVVISSEICLHHVGHCRIHACAK